MQKLLMAMIATVMSAGLFFAGAAEATTIDVRVKYFDDENDCSGLFGKPFDTCVDPRGSPVIAKTDGAGDVIEINSKFTNVLAGMFDVKFDDSSKSSGTWTYKPCATCVQVTSWAVKAGSGFNWFYTDPQTAVLSGTWSTPFGKEMSHITFYDTAAIPLPAAGFLLIGALGGLVTLRRRRKAA